MVMKTKSISASILLAAALVLAGAGGVLAYQIETLPNTEVAKDVVLGPGKVEVALSPGESATRVLYFTNRTGRKVDFTVNAEDFKGSRDPKEGVIFMGGEKGPYSLKDFLHPDTWTFTLEHGQRIALPVEIAIPQDAEPGGKYGVVFATAQPPELETSGSQGNAAAIVGIASRVGALFFVKVKGDAVENGSLKSFSTINSRRFFEQGPVDFQFVYENNGNIHVNPYGILEITNALGKKAGEIKIDPYFAMPDSERLNEVKWTRPMLFGKYTATLRLNRGYQDIIDTMSFDFWVIPWKLLAAGLAAAFILALMLRWLFGHFEIKRKA